MRHDIRCIVILLVILSTITLTAEGLPVGQDEDAVDACVELPLGLDLLCDDDGDQDRHEDGGDENEREETEDGDRDQHEDGGDEDAREGTEPTRAKTETETTPELTRTISWEALTETDAGSRPVDSGPVRERAPPTTAIPTTVPASKPTPTPTSTQTQTSASVPTPTKTVTVTRRERTATPTSQIRTQTPVQTSTQTRTATPTATDIPTSSPETDARATVQKTSTSTRARVRETKRRSETVTTTANNDRTPRQTGTRSSPRPTVATRIPAATATTVVTTATNTSAPSSSESGELPVGVPLFVGVGLVGIVVAGRSYLLDGLRDVLDRAIDLIVQICSIAGYAHRADKQQLLEDDTRYEIFESVDNHPQYITKPVS